MAAVVAVTSPAQAQNRNWDTNGTALGIGGAGIWNASNANWSPNADGVSGPYAAWNNAALDNAIFGGTAGMVTVDGTIAVHNLTFGLQGYTLSGGILTLGDITPTITGGATINSVIAGSSGLTKASTSTLFLNGLNTFTGGISLNDGVLIALNDAALGNASNNIVTAAGKSVRLAIGGASSSRTVTIGDLGTLTLEGTGAGSLLITGNGSVSTTTNGVTLSNNGNTYTGLTLFTGCGSAPCSTSFTSIADVGVASSLGAPDAAHSIITYVQAGGIASDLNYVGDGDSSNRNWQLNTSNLSVRNRGTGTLTLTGDVNITAGGSFNADTADIALLGVLSGGAYGFNGLAGNAVTLGNTNTFTGVATIGGLVNAAVLGDGGMSSSLGAGTHYCARCWHAELYRRGRWQQSHLDRRFRHWQHPQ